MQQDQQLVTVERVVAFVVGPIVIAASGTLSALAVKWGFNVTAAEVVGAFATGGAGAGALAWKWLHGRQIYEAVEHELHATASTIPGGESFIKTTVKDLEGLAESAAAKAADAITKQTAGGQGGSSPPAVEPIPAAADPAPSSGGQVAEQADAGAATSQ